MLSLVSLSVLVGGFEAIHALNVGVERIGRYLQVYYEANRRTARPGKPPQWPSAPGCPAAESTRCSRWYSPRWPRSIWLWCFLTCTAITSYVVVLPVHAIFWIRVIRARWAAAGQRADGPRDIPGHQVHAGPT